MDQSATATATARKRPGRPAGPTIQGEPVRCILVHSGYGSEFQGPEIQRLSSETDALRLAVMWGRSGTTPQSLTAHRKGPKGWECIA